MSVLARHRPEALQALEAEMGTVVRRIRRVIAERARAVDPELAIAGFLVLSELAESGPARSADVVDALGIDKGAISRHVQHLVELGLVIREPDPADGRAALLEVSSEGRRRLEAVAEQRRQCLDDRLAHWSGEELRSFVDALARYNQSLS